MAATKTSSGFRYYMHEGPESISFELAGSLSGEAGRELERAKRSVTSDRALTFDLTYVTEVDTAAQKLLRCWHDDGAQLVAKSPQARAIVAAITGKGPEFIETTALHLTWLPFRVPWLGAIMLMMSFLIAPASAASLKPETIQVWDEYVKAAVGRNDQRVCPGSVFLSAEEATGEPAKLRSGEIVVAPAGPNVPMKVPSGLIHDWMGAVFIPGATLPDVLRVVRDYERYRDIYHPYVAGSRPIAVTEKEDRYSVLMMNKSVIAKVALDGDYRSVYTRLDDRHWYSITKATRIQEVSDYGTPSQHSLPASEGTGLMWRLFSMTRFEERDGGVYVEIEVIVLSRDVPAALSWLIDPIVRRISRSSLVTSLQQTRDAVRLSTAGISRSSSRPIPSSPVRSFR
jgi:hypothetical protein